RSTAAAGAPAGQITTCAEDAVGLGPAACSSSRRWRRTDCPQTGRRRIVAFGRVADLVLGKYAAFFASKHIKQLHERAVAVGHPVGSAIHAGKDSVVTFGRGIVTWNHVGAAFVVEAAGPGLADEILRQQEFAAVAIQEVIEAIARRPRHQVALLAAEQAI